ncbi:hypothetical protein CDD81_6939 [Ophiocordyceps australis]|uniref:Major facilitator superfamily (MFS) profile domain-containing protein n=1 Tax=Ophiocordyceps australis TaxID=1399860 RepID=A0A2C5Y4I0_9HYPO|nr:hypothetical protein CDD81_6939 [Ophiocordyceps australis]
MAPSLWSKLRRKDKLPVFLRLRSSTQLIVCTVTLAVFTDLFPYAVIVPVLPEALVQRCAQPDSKVQYWTSVSLAVYGAAVLITSPLWGYFADRFQNRRVPMIVGLVFLAGATIILAFMKNVTMLMIGRIFQGLSAALTWSVGLALVVDTVDPKRIGHAMGWIGASMSWATLIAPLLGGIVNAAGGWHSVWAMCYGLVGVDILLRLFIIEKKTLRKYQRQRNNDAEQGIYDDIVSGSSISEEPRQVSKDKSAAAGHELEINSRPPRKRAAGIKTIVTVLKNPRLLAAMWGCVVESAVQTAFDAVLPKEVQDLFGWNTVGQGLIFLPFVLPTLLGPLVGKVGDRYGPKWLTTFGFSFSTPFLICLRFVDSSGKQKIILLCALLACIGIGISCTLGPLMAEITWSVRSSRLKKQAESRADGEAPPESDDPEPIALAYAFYNVAFATGAMVGPLLGGFIRDSAGMPTVGWVLGLMTAFTAVTQMLWSGEPSNCRLKRFLYPRVCYYMGLLHGRGKEQTPEMMTQEQVGSKTGAAAATTTTTTTVSVENHGSEDVTEKRAAGADRTTS